MTRQTVSNSEQSALVATNLPFETTDLNGLEIARISGADGCYPVPPDDEGGPVRILTRHWKIFWRILWKIS